MEMKHIVKQTGNLIVQVCIDLRLHATKKEMKDAR